MPLAHRVRSLDIVRGVVMVLMAIDHVRVYSGLPGGGPTAAIFFTRWVTHFCSPWFVFLAGTGAFLHGRRLIEQGHSVVAAQRSLARYLITRGALLVLLELTLIRVAWSFRLDLTGFVLAGVIWMLGWCMILLATLVRLRIRTIGAIGIVLMVGQQLFRYVPLVLPAPLRDSIGWIWEFIYSSGLQPPGPLNILYVIVPWIGVMAAGYAFGAIVIREPAARRRLCLRIGLSATGLFLVFVVAYMFLAANPSGPSPKLFAALSPSKYPPSQTFLLMTLGPGIALLPLLEGMRGRIAAVFTTFGRVPLFYYLLHIPVIHIAALVVTEVREGRVHPEWYATAPYTSIPRGHQWTLPLMYLVFGICVVVLYGACRWYSGFKTRHPDSWLRYI